MKDKMKQILDNFHKYNSEHMAQQAFGLNDEIEYDALVVAPSFSPYKLHLEEKYKVTTMREGAYLGGYMVEAGDLKIAWIKIGSSASNLIDHLAICAELSFKKVIFIGAVGALKEGFDLGDICTPSYSISGSVADAYLMKDSIKEDMRFEKVYPDMTFIDEMIELGKSLGHEIKSLGRIVQSASVNELSALFVILSSEHDLSPPQRLCPCCGRCRRSCS